jgi:hypothetical protein
MARSPDRRLIQVCETRARVGKFPIGKKLFEDFIWRGATTPSFALRSPVRSNRNLRAHFFKRLQVVLVARQ